MDYPLVFMKLYPQYVARPTVGQGAPVKTDQHRQLSIDADYDWNMVVPDLVSLMMSLW
jgi:spore maturation protein CgeB